MVVAQEKETVETYFKIPNWDEYQHYGKRNPPWIKLHRKLLKNYKFTKMPDAAKAHLMQIWLVVSEEGNELPFDSEWIGNKIHAKEQVDLELLAKQGFIKVYGENASKVLACIRGTEVQRVLLSVDNRVDQATNDGRAGRSNSATDDTAQKAFVEYQQLARIHGLAVPRKLSNGRAAKMKKRLKEIGGLEGWSEAMKLVSQSPFLLGSNDRGWKCSLDFLLQPSKLERLLEGTYSHTPPDTGPGKPADVSVDDAVELMQRRREEAML